MLQRHIDLCPHIDICAPMHHPIALIAAPHAKQIDHIVILSSRIYKHDQSPIFFGKPGIHAFPTRFHPLHRGVCGFKRQQRAIYNTLSIGAFLFHFINQHSIVAQGTDRPASVLGMGIAHIGEQFLSQGKKHQIQIVRMGMPISPRKMQMHLHLMFALSSPQPGMSNTRQQCRRRLFKRFDIGINPPTISICPGIVHGNPPPIWISANIQKMLCLSHNGNISLQIQLVVSHAIVRYITQWVGIPFQRVKYHLHTRHCHPVIPQTAFMPEAIRIKLTLKQTDTASNGFVNKFWII